MVLSLISQPLPVQRISPIQRLPDIILLRIADYLLDEGRSPDTWSTEPAHASLTRMMSVCERWHSVCAHVCFREAWLGYSEYSCRDAPARDMRKIHCLGYASLVKRMVIYLPETLFADGSAMPSYLELLRSMHLSRVRELLVYVYQCFSYRPYDVETTRIGVGRAVSAIKAALPNVESLAISSIQVNNSMPNSHVVPELSRALQMGKSELHVASPSALVLDTDIYRIDPRLTTISLDTRVVWNDNLVSVIQLNAPVLESLDIAHISSAKLQRLLQYADGSPVVYASLESLTFEIKEPKLSREDTVAIQLAGTEFPRLRRLVCGGDFPFSDDTVLLQNRARLEHLKITIGEVLFACFTTNRPDQAVVYPSLTKVDISVSCALSSMQSASDMDQLFLQVLCMAPNAVHLRFPDGPLDATHILSTTRTRRNIRTIDCPELRLTPADLIQLSKVCPLLHSATFALIADPTAPAPNYDTRAVQRSYVRRLQMHVHDTSPVGPHHFGRYFLLLRLQIPSLKWASMSTLDESDAQKIAAGFEEAIGQPGDSTYKYVKGLHVGIGLNLF